MEERSIMKMGGGQFTGHETIYEDIISIENLFTSWYEFRKGKAARNDIQEYELDLENNIFRLYYSLKNKTYAHGGYSSFYVSDPKRRHIHKPLVQDRLLHHAVFRKIEPMFEKKFIYDSFSCRKDKGTHAAIRRFQSMAWKLSRNNTRNVWILKLDIKSFFKSISPEILYEIISKTITEKYTLALIKNIIDSFPEGIPLGNLTSQLFANVYMNEFDQFVKHKLKASFYIRYSDDFLLGCNSKEKLERLIPVIQEFLGRELNLDLHLDKIYILKYRSGVDFLGFVCFPYFRILRTRTKIRMMRRLNKNNAPSYFGLVKHARSRGIRKKMRFWLQNEPNKLLAHKDEKSSSGRFSTSGVF